MSYPLPFEIHDTIKVIDLNFNDLYLVSETMSKYAKNAMDDKATLKAHV